MRPSQDAHKADMNNLSRYNLQACFTCGPVQTLSIVSRSARRGEVTGVDLLLRNMNNYGNTDFFNTFDVNV